MITESTLYWITRLDNFYFMFLVMLALFAGVGLVSALIVFDNSCTREERDFAKRLFNFFAIPILLVAILGLVFVPTTKEMCAIKVIPAITQNEKVQNLGDKTLSLAEAWLEELKPKKK